ADARTRAVLDAAGDGIITADERGMIRTFNRAARRIFGFEPDEVLGRNLALLLGPANREEHPEDLGAPVDTGEIKILGADSELQGWQPVPGRAVRQQDPLCRQAALYVRPPRSDGAQAGRGGAAPGPRRVGGPRPGPHRPTRRGCPDLAGRDRRTLEG